MMTLLALAAAAQATLQPLGKWSVEYEEPECTLSRGFGDPARPTTFGLQPTVDMISGRLVLIVPAPASGVTAGAGEVIVSPARTTFPVRWVTGPLPSGKERVVRIDVPRAFWEALPQVAGVELRLGGAAPIGLVFGDTSRALAALRTCEETLMRRWGADPAAVIRPPDSQAAGLFRVGDYPETALRDNRQGRVYTMAVVNPQGRLTTCTVLKSSGTPALDQQSCRVLAARGRFDPVAEGPDKRYLFVNVVWAIPN